MDEADRMRETAARVCAREAAGLAGQTRGPIAPFSGEMRVKTLNKIADRQQEAWDTVLQSRSGDRLVSSDYIRVLFDNFMEMHGDRYYGDDGAVIGGIATFTGCRLRSSARKREKRPKII